MLVERVEEIWPHSFVEGSLDLKHWSFVAEITGFKTLVFCWGDHWISNIDLLLGISLNFLHWSFVGGDHWI